MTLSADSGMDSGLEVVSTADIVLIAQDVWGSFLDERLEPAARPASFGDGAGVVTGAVEVLETFRGHVVLVCTAATARAVAGAMFRLDPAAVGDTDVADALGELTNMIGGNVKSVLPAPSRLSLPVVHDGAWQPAGERPVGCVDFATPDGGPVRVCVYRAD